MTLATSPPNVYMERLVFSGLRITLIGRCLCLVYDTFRYSASVASPGHFLYAFCDAPVEGRPNISSNEHSFWGRFASFFRQATRKAVHRQWEKSIGAPSMLYSDGCETFSWLNCAKIKEMSHIHRNVTSIELRLPFCNYRCRRWLLSRWGWLGL